MKGNCFVRVVHVWSVGVVCSRAFSVLRLVHVPEGVQVPNGVIPSYNS